MTLFTHIFPDRLHFDNAGIVNGRRSIILTRPYRRITSLGIDVAPAGTISDGASIPQIAWTIIGSPFDKYLEDCIFHDVDYSALGRRSRKEADFLLRETMWNHRIELWKTASFYTALRLFGGRNFKGNPQQH